MCATISTSRPPLLLPGTLIARLNFFHSGPAAMMPVARIEFAARQCIARSTAQHSTTQNHCNKGEKHTGTASAKAHQVL
jgi:hypothetical protein